MMLRAPRAPYKAWAFICLTQALVGTGCSHLSAQYVMPGYGAQGPQVIKHVTLAAWAPQNAPGLAPVVAQVAVDMIKLRKNYLVHDVVPWSLQETAGCSEGIEGILLLRVLDSHTEPPEDTTLHGSLTLLRCSDGAQVFRSEGQLTTAVHDKSLADLRGSYLRQLGEPGGRWAAPAFALVQALAEPLPDPHLSEQDIEAKIELGAAPSSAHELVSG